LEDAARTAQSSHGVAASANLGGSQSRASAVHSPSHSSVRHMLTRLLIRDVTNTYSRISACLLRLTGAG
jgi:hypothetical protein